MSGYLLAALMEGGTRLVAADEQNAAQPYLEPQGELVTHLWLKLAQRMLLC